MKKILMFFLVTHTVSAQAQDIIQQMYTRYAKKFRKSLSFEQQTNTYRNDSLIKTATWYEVLVYPDKLRIDIDDPSKGNSIFFVNDSIYRRQNGQTKNLGHQPHDLLFVLGGMYSFPLDKVYTKLKAMGYNTDKSFETTWKGRKVVVMGTDKDESESNQFWVDKEKLVTVRILNNKEGQKTETVCGDYVPLGDNLCETNIEFYINGKLRQTEKYTDLKENVRVDMQYLDPYKTGHVTFWK
jgi:hypothetical protein